MIFPSCISKHFWWNCVAWHKIFWRSIDIHLATCQWDAESGPIYLRATNRRKNRLNNRQLSVYVSRIKNLPSFLAGLRYIWRFGNRLIIQAVLWTKLYHQRELVIVKSCWRNSIFLCRGDIKDHFVLFGWFFLKNNDTLRAGSKQNGLHFYSERETLCLHCCFKRLV